MKRIISIFLILLLMVPGLGRAEDLTAEWMERAFRSRSVVGGAVIVSRYGETVFSYVYGSKSARRMDPVTLNTCYRIASVTKLVTAVGLMRLYDRGYFQLDDSISDLLSFPVVNTAYKNDPITVRQVLSHTSGVIQSQNTKINWAYVSPRNTETLFVQYAKPGTKYNYSNINGSFFGALIEALTGQSLNTYMSQNVFTPLSMNAAYTARLLPDTGDISSRMSKQGTNILSPEYALTLEYEDTCDPANHLSYSVGGLYISADGMNKLGMMLCNEGWLDGVRILSPYTVRLMQEDQRFQPGSSVTGESRYGLGMQRVTDAYGNVWYGHQGMMDGLSSDLFYLPEKDLVVTVIANGYLPLKSGSLVSIAIQTMERAVETDWDRRPAHPAFTWADSAPEEND